MLDLMPNQPLDMLMEKDMINSTMAQIDARDAILFAQINFKYYYDQTHQLMNLKVSNFAVL